MNKEKIEVNTENGNEIAFQGFPSTRVESFNSDQNNANLSAITSDIDRQGETADEKKYIARRPKDVERNRYPYCIVWTPLPLISWFLPMIGHTGICTSDGKIHDFAGSYFISVDNMAFGNPYKYVELNPDEREQEQWDEAISKSDNRFTNEEHNLFLNNCHSHVAHALNVLNYKNYSSYNMVNIWWMCISQGKYVSYLHILKTYLGFFILLLLILFVSRL